MDGESQPSPRCRQRRASKIPLWVHVDPNVLVRTVPVTRNCCRLDIAERNLGSLRVAEKRRARKHDPLDTEQASVEAICRSVIPAAKGSDQGRPRLAGRPRGELLALLRVMVGLEVLDEDLLRRRIISELRRRTDAAPIRVEWPVHTALQIIPETMVPVRVGGFRVYDGGHRVVLGVNGLAGPWVVPGVALLVFWHRSHPSKRTPEGLEIFFVPRQIIGEQEPVLAGVGALVVLTVVALSWKGIAIQYHLRKLRSDPEYVREVIEEPEGTWARDALRRAIATPEGESII